MKKTIIGLGFLLSSCSPAAAQDRQIHDHYKQIIEQKPYHVEVCRDVTTSGDKSGDMVKGAIIGGILGNNVGNVENGGTLGAVLGAMLGHSNSNAKSGTQRRCKTEVRYKEEVRTIYSHSHIEFWYQGKKYNLKFKK